MTLAGPPSRQRARDTCSWPGMPGRRRRRSTRKSSRAMSSAGTARQFVAAARDAVAAGLRRALRRRSSNAARAANPSPTSSASGSSGGCRSRSPRDVLVPRPGDRSLIVEEALSGSPARRRRSIVDVGTGSGCVAIALATRVPRGRARHRHRYFRCGACASRAATRCANGVADRIEFREAICWSGIAAQDLIVVQPAVCGVSATPRRSRRRCAITNRMSRSSAATTACDLPPPVPARRHAALAAGGRLIVEVGYDQAGRSRRWRRSAGGSTHRLDLQEIERVRTLRQRPVLRPMSAHAAASAPELSHARLPVLPDRPREIPASLDLRGRRRRRLGDINPQAPLHALIIPRRHIATLNDLTARGRRAVGAMIAARRRASRESTATPSAASARSSTRTPTPASRCSTSTCTSWPGEAWPPG